MKDLNETTNTAPSAGDAERSYRQALKLERDRERKHRKYTAKAATDARAFHYEMPQTHGEDDEELDYGWDLTDDGRGAEQIVARCDDGPAYYRTCVKRAMNRLRRRPELRRTLRLVIRHWPRREDAIWEILASRRCPTWDAARKQYFAHLEKLLKIFCGQ